MNSYAEVIQFLYGLQRFGMKFGLRGIQELLHYLGNPHLKFSSIHIAGTNGKGSTAAMVASMFTAAGYKTGLFTSPHLIDYRERIRVNGVPISRSNCTRIACELRQEIVTRRCTFFEATTAIAFQHFAESDIDIAVVETGLGGRLDATNVLQPVASVITGVGLEHTEILGRTLGRIAQEKSGIIKRGVPCISGVYQPIPSRIIRERCTRMNATLSLTRSVSWRLKESNLHGSVVNFYHPTFVFKDLVISMAGAVQAANAATALLTVGKVSDRFPITEEHMRTGLAHIQTLTGIRGRLQIVKNNPLVLADTAHNPQAMNALVQSLLGVGVRQIDLVFGVVKDKDYVSMVKAVKPLTRHAILVQPKTDRARSPEEVAAEFHRNHIGAQISRSVPEGVKRSIELAVKGCPIVITGSNFVVGEALAYLDGKKYLTINQ